MSGSWPSMIDPIQLADKGARLTAALPMKGMRRLLELYPNDTGSVAIDLQFERNAGDGVRMMYGRIEAQLRLVCQRCLEPFDYPLHSTPQLLLLCPGERPDLMESGDAPADTLMVEQPVSLSGLIEDELLLAMPMIPMHAGTTCPAPPTRSAAVKLATPAKKKAGQKLNPFLVLEKLKRTDRK
jgi:uncharacterized protein